mgnify:FL=1
MSTEEAILRVQWKAQEMYFPFVPADVTNEVDDS